MARTLLVLCVVLAFAHILPQTGAKLFKKAQGLTFNKRTELDKVNAEPMKVAKSIFVMEHRGDPKLTLDIIGMLKDYLSYLHELRRLPEGFDKAVEEELRPKGVSLNKILDGIENPLVFSTVNLFLDNVNVRKYFTPDPTHTET